MKAPLERHTRHDGDIQCRLKRGEHLSCLIVITVWRVRPSERSPVRQELCPGPGDIRNHQHAEEDAQEIKSSYCAVHPDISARDGPAKPVTGNVL